MIPFNLTLYCFFPKEKNINLNIAGISFNFSSIYVLSHKDTLFKKHYVLITFKFKNQVLI